MLKYGTELAKALEAVNFFPEMFISRFKTAAETGAVKDTANQLADFYQMENHYAMKNLINFIEVYYLRHHYGRNDFSDPSLLGDGVDEYQVDVGSRFGMDTVSSQSMV